MIHYLSKEMAYTACRRLPDNGIIKLNVTDDLDKVTCKKCLEKEGNK